jgi:hypothetical protein
MPAVKLKFGPADHGRPVTAEELDDAEYVEGYKYEVIDGKFYVSPQPTFYEHRLERWLRLKLEGFAVAPPEVIGWVATKAACSCPAAPS